MRRQLSKALLFGGLGKDLARHGGVVIKRTSKPSHSQSHSFLSLTPVWVVSSSRLSAMPNKIPVFSQNRPVFFMAGLSHLTSTVTVLNIYRLCLWVVRKMTKKPQAQSTTNNKCIAFLGPTSFQLPRSSLASLISHIDSSLRSFSFHGTPWSFLGLPGIDRFMHTSLPITFTYISNQH